jgi:hypothetical protein
MTVALLPITLLLLAGPVEVEAELCPSRPDIESALSSLLPASQDARPPDVARVFRQGKLLRIELTDPNGILIGGRSLDDSDHCTELAMQVAVVIASLATDVHPAFHVPGQEAPSPSPRASASPSATPAPLPQPVARSSFDVAAGVSLSYSDSLALGGLLAGIWIPRATGFGIRVSAGTETTRSVSLGEGQQASWARWTATTEADWRYGRGRLMMDVHAGLAWTLLHADGSGFSGFSNNASDNSFSPGTLAGARLSWGLTTHTAAWLGLDVTSWMVRQSVTDTPARAGQQVPLFSVLASLGVALGRFNIQPLGSAGLGAQ